MKKLFLRRKLILWVGSFVGVVLLVTTILTIYIASRSDEWWRGKITTTLSNSLGTEVEIQEGFQFELGRTTSVKARSVRVKNPDWAKSTDLLKLGSILVKFDLLSVLSETLWIYQLELSDIELSLEENKDGEKNWIFDDQSKSSTSRKSAQGIKLPVHIEHLSLEHAHLSLSQPHRKYPVVLQIEAIRGSHNPNDEAIFEGNGQLGGVPISLNGRMGKITDIINQGPATYELSGKWGDAIISSEGSTDSLAAPLRPMITLSVNGPEFKQVTQALGVPTVAAGAFEVQLNMTPKEERVFSEIRGKLGQFQLKADVSADDIESLENINASANLSGKNLALASKLLGWPTLPRDAFEIDILLQRTNHDTQIKKMMASVGMHRMSIEGFIGAWPDLKDTNLNVLAKGPDLAAFTPLAGLIGLGELPAGPYSVNVTIEPEKNNLLVRSSKFEVGQYQVTAHGDVFTKPELKAELDVAGSGPDLSMFSRLAKIQQLPAWPYRVQGKIKITEKEITLIESFGTTEGHNISVTGPVAFSTEGPVRLNVKGGGPSLQAVLQGMGYQFLAAEAAYQVTGNVELIKNRLVVATESAQLGPMQAVLKLTIPDLNIPQALIVDLNELMMTDFSTAIALLGVELNLPQSMPASLSGQIKRTNNTTSLSKLRGNIGKSKFEIDGIVGDPPEYNKTKLKLDISGTNLEHFLPHSVDEIIPFSIHGKISMNKGDMQFENVQLEVADVTAKVHGKLGHWETFKDTALDLTVEGPDTKILSAILKRPLPAGAIKINSHVRADKEAIHIDQMQAQLGRSNLTADLKLINGEPPSLAGQITSSHLDLAFLQLSPDVQESTTTPQVTNEVNSLDSEEDTLAVQLDNYVFSDTPIEFKLLETLNLELKLRADEIVNLWEFNTLKQFKVDMQLTEQRLSLMGLEVDGIRDGKLKGELIVDRDAELTRIDLNLNAEKLRMGLAVAPGQPIDTYPPLDINAKLTGSGKTYRALIASLNGRIKGVQGAGRVNNSRLGVLFSDVFYEVFNRINPFASTETTTGLDCGVYLINLKDGKAEVQDIVIRTDKLTILSAGLIDLKTEGIDIKFETRPRRGVGISASMITNPYLKLGGTLSSPSIELDPTRGTVATGVAVATGGLSFIYKGVWDRYFTSRDPCGQALARDTELQTIKTKQE